MGHKDWKKIFVISAAYYIIMCIPQSHTTEKRKTQKRMKLKCQKGIILYTIISALFDNNNNFSRNK